ncbi:hypothetical protein GUY44_24835 [Pimelobacter simplex]|uniref:Uncharacterized protein n=1 Tax=Nocardioides simplex TaxID=2045 RepID=A0A0A1DNA6_NOCSI|nr:hypothetical protein [Pimelobacter simplex]AIY18107.1 hypothetical protein KR76_17440 [Pimelobacter simplex]MCG8153723.1 hypothetical protein [Pimelobacter simplex]GEB15676.1 hypothetical protein NSI01_39910 [Pimelobacter simplex]SFN09155.1 hypothetical protein SAMN05421671_5081 [Pimelobacter simplex]
MGVGTGDLQTTFADALGAAMERRGATLTHLRDRLADRGHPVSLTALSYWRSGQREPERSASLEAIPELEALLGLEQGALSRRLSGRMRRRVGAVEPFDELLGDPAVDAVIGEEDVCRVSSHLVVDVGAQGEIQRARVRQVLVADREGVDGVTLFVGPDVGTQENDIVMEAVAGCSIEEISDLENGIRGSRLVFERPLALGESTITEIEARRAHGLDLETDYALAAEQRLEEALVWVRFHPDKVPSRCWVYFQEGGLRHAWPVDLDGGRSVHYRQTAFGPGYLGVRWEW